MIITIIIVITIMLIPDADHSFGDMFRTCGPALLNSQNVSITTTTKVLVSGMITM